MLRYRRTADAGYTVAALCLLSEFFTHVFPVPKSAFQRTLLLVPVGTSVEQVGPGLNSRGLWQGGDLPKGEVEALNLLGISQVP